MTWKKRTRGTKHQVGKPFKIREPRDHERTSNKNRYMDPSLVSCDFKKVGKGVRKFGGKLYLFKCKAVMVGSFADNGYQRYEEEVSSYANSLRERGYSIRLVKNSAGDILIYTRGERIR